MEKLPKMVNMARTLSEKTEYGGLAYPVGQIPNYPYGLCISLCDEELEKLKLDAAGVEVGDEFHIFALGKVTSVSRNDTGDGEKTRIEIQITDIAEESETEENERASKKLRSLKYKD